MAQPLVVDFEGFLSRRRIEHFDDYHSAELAIANTLHGSIGDLPDIVSYDKTYEFAVSNIGVLPIDEKGRYYYEFTSYEIGADFVDNIRASGPISAYIYAMGTPECHLSRFIYAASVYRQHVVRVVFYRVPTLADKFSVTLRQYMCTPEDHTYLGSSYVKTPEAMYANGMCTPKL